MGLDSNLGAWGWATRRDRWLQVENLRFMAPAVFDSPLSRGLARLGRGAGSSGCLGSPRRNSVLRALAFDLLTEVPGVNLLQNFRKKEPATHTVHLPAWTKESETDNHAHGSFSLQS